MDWLVLPWIALSVAVALATFWIERKLQSRIRRSHAGIHRTLFNRFGFQRGIGRAYYEFVWRGGWQEVDDAELGRLCRVFRRLHLTLLGTLIGLTITLVATRT